jgi:hypothetical protein
MVLWADSVCAPAAAVWLHVNPHALGPALSIQWPFPALLLSSATACRAHATPPCAEDCCAAAVQTCTTSQLAGTVRAAAAVMKWERFAPVGPQHALLRLGQVDGALMSPEGPCVHLHNTMAPAQTACTQCVMVLRQCYVTAGHGRRCWLWLCCACLVAHMSGPTWLGSQCQH